VQLLAGLEAHGFAWSDADLGASAGIAADASFAGADAEDTEASEFDSFAGSESLFEALEDGINGSLGLGAGEARALDHVMDDVLLNQWGYLAGLSRKNVLRPTIMMLQVLERLWNHRRQKIVKRGTFVVRMGLRGTRRAERAKIPDYVSDVEIWLNDFVEWTAEWT